MGCSSHLQLGATTPDSPGNPQANAAPQRHRGAGQDAENRLATVLTARSLIATNGWFAPTVLASFAELHLVDAPPSFDGLLAKSLHLRWTAAEGLRQSWKTLGDGLGGCESGSKTELADWRNGRNISRKLKLLPTAHTPSITNVKGAT